MSPFFNLCFICVGTQKIYLWLRLKKINKKQLSCFVLHFETITHNLD